MFPNVDKYSLLDSHKCGGSTLRKSISTELLCILRRFFDFSCLFFFAMFANIYFIYMCISKTASRTLTLNLSSSDDVSSKDAIGAGPSCFCFCFRGEFDLDLSIVVDWLRMWSRNI